MSEENRKFSRKEYEKQYKKEHYKRFSLRVRLDDQNGVLDKINNTDNVNEYIYNLILEDIKKNLNKAIKKD